ncbi:MAG: cation transporter [Deltaproteobacteria bacterium]|nr:cation transporter [Deltaproteobacteria bacterium]
MDDRDRRVRRVLWAVLAANLAVTAIKLAVGWWTGALAVLADGVHAMLDSSSNIVGLVGLWLAARPPDADHPYGHRRFETLAAATIGLLIVGGLASVTTGLIETLRAGRSAARASWASAALVAFTIGANVVVSWYEARRGRELSSPILLADAGHTRSDALGATAVLASFAGVALGYWWADPLAAVIVVVLIAKTAYGILRTNLGVLADEARLDPDAVREVALRIEGVRGAHKVRSRGALDHVHVDLHIHVDPEMSVARAHDLTHAVADEVRRSFPSVADVVIHTEPADGREKAG